MIKTDKEINDLLMADPKLFGYVANHTKNLKQMSEFWAWAVMTWKASQGESVLTPMWMRASDAADITSVICETKAYLQTRGGEVEIKKVAEIRGSRFNTGKLRMDLIDPQAMAGLAAVLTKGAAKYTANNWRDGLPFTETVASLLRHTFAFLGGEDIDSETGLPHVDHMQCNTMFLSWMTKNRKDMDDRWHPPLAITEEQVKAAMKDLGKSS